MTRLLRSPHVRLAATVLVAALTLTALIGRDDRAEATDPGVEVVYVADGRTFADALVGSVLAAMNNAPLLTVEGARHDDEIPPDTRAELERLQPIDRIRVFGGSVAISDAVLSELAGFATGGDAARIAGQTRYDTAAAIARALPEKIKNADLLDGMDSSDLLGATEQAADSDKLDGMDSTEFLGATEQAVDSDRVDGFDASQLAAVRRSRAPADTRVTTVDDANNVGRYSSVTVGTDGLPIISYYDFSADALKVGHCTDITCTGADTNTVDDGNNVGRHTSMTIGADGLPIISYYDSSAGALKVAHCTDVACTAADTNTVDNPTNRVGFYTSITVGTDGLPVISYYDSSADALKVAHCTDVACTAADTNTVDDDPDNDVGKYTSIAIGVDGLPLISYRDTTLDDLKVAHCTDAACTAADTASLDGDFSDTGRYTSVTIGTDGLGRISYRDDLDGNLRLAHCDDVACTDATTMTLDSSDDVGRFTSVTVGADGLPMVSYYDDSDGALKVARCTDAACSGVTTTTVDDSANDVGRFTSVTVGADGLPVISYWDVDSGALKVAHCSNPFCVPYLRRR